MAKDISIPTNTPIVEEETKEVQEEVVQEQEPTIEEEAPLTHEEADYIKRVFFEEDELVYLRDGKKYRIPPLSLRDGLELMKKLNSIDSSMMVLNLIDDGEGNTKYETLMEVLHMAFKPYYPEITKDYLADFVDLNTAKNILDIMIGLNQIKKNM